MRNFYKNLFVGFTITTVVLNGGFGVALANGSTTLNTDPQDFHTLRVNNYTVNPTSNSASWGTSVYANPGDKISFAVYYHNTGSETAHNVKVRILPQNSPSGTYHTFTATVSADNAASVSGSASVTVSSAQMIGFVSGTVLWQPNQMTSGSVGLPNGQNGSELFTTGFNIGDVAPGWSTQGNVIVGYIVSQSQQQTLPTVTLSANPTSIQAGGSSVLTWNAVNASHCTASGGWSGNKALSGSQTVTPSVATTYNIICFNGYGQASASATVYVSQSLPSVSLTASPTNVQSGGSSVLSWSSSNAISCTASNGWSGVKSLSGSQAVFPSGFTTYSIICFNSYGQASDSVTVSVNQQSLPTVTLTVSPTSVSSGNTAVVTWNTTNATYCTASNGWSGTKSASGSETVTPQVTTTYNIICFNSYGQAASGATVYVSQSLPSVTITASPTSISSGGSSVLTWNTTNATSCSASNGWSGTKSTSGSETVFPPNTTTYSVICFNSYGQASDSVTVYASQQLPTVTINSNPSSIQSGNSSYLTWSSTNATTCTASNGWSGNQAMNGSQTVYPASTANYTLTCFNSYGQASQSATVYVTNVQQLPYVNIDANPVNVQAGNTTYVTWTSTNATACTASNGWSGGQSLSGSQNVYPSNTTTYTITCYNSYGQSTDSITVYTNGNVQQPTVNLYANQTTVNPGSGVTLNWNSYNTTSCYGSGGWSGSQPVSGTQTVYPSGTTNYTLTCSGSGGSVSSQVTVYTGQNNYNYNSVPTVTLMANPGTVSQGATSVLNWSSNNANYCYASNGWSGTKSTYGSQVVTPTNTTTYTLNCTNNYGTSFFTATVYVNQTYLPPAPQQFSASCVASSQSTRVGQAVTFAAGTAGGTAPVSYQWSGAFGGTDISRTITFSSTGTKIATITATDAYGNTAQSNCSTIVSGTTVISQPPVTVTPVPPSPPPVVVAVAPICHVEKVLSCSNGKTYNIGDGSQPVYDTNGVLIWTGESQTPTAQPVTDTEDTIAGTSRNSGLAALFLTDQGNLSRLSFLLVWFLLILLLAGVAYLLYYRLQGK